MAAGTDPREVDWGAIADPILVTAPWRPQQPAAEAAPEPDWAGRGFSRPGPGPEADREAEPG
jgi:hypothetical protein